MRKLILQDLYFQQKISNIEITPTNGMNKLQYIEGELLEALRIKNPRLNVSAVEYLDVKNEFPEFIGGNYSAVIVEETSHTYNDFTRDDSRYFINSKGNTIQQKIIALVFVSPATKDEGRNITVTQDIFPHLMDYLKKYIKSSSYTYANHPFYYFSLMAPGGSLQASILSNYAKLNLLEVEFVELFPSGVDFSSMPNDVSGALEFIAKLPKNRKQITDIISTEDYEFDISNKKLTIFSKSLLVDFSQNIFGNRVKRANNGNAEFHGSEEKFYWLDVLAMFELAVRNGYEVDYTQLWSWYNQNRKNSSFGNSRKFARFEFLLNYFDKKTLKG